MAAVLEASEAFERLRAPRAQRRVRGRRLRDRLDPFRRQVELRRRKKNRAIVARPADRSSLAQKRALEEQAAITMAVSRG